MSIVQEGGSVLDPLLIKRVGYGLLVTAIVAGVTAIFEHNAFLAAVDIALTFGSAAVTLFAPEVFEVPNRGRGKRGLNPLFLVPAGILFFNGIEPAFVDAGPIFVAAFVGAAAGAGLAALRMSRPGVGSPAQLVTMLAVLGAGLGAGAVALADVRFDTFAPTPFRATIVSMYVSHGKSTTYYLRLAPWGPMTAGGDVAVSRSQYLEFNPGDQACLALHSGALSMRWLTVDACSGPQ
jgi:hypothetical protein